MLLTIPGIGLLTCLTGASFLLLFDFDGIEFNGDSHVYYLNALHLSSSILKGSSPEPTYWPYGYPSLLSLSFMIGDISFETGRWVNILFGGLLSVTFCFIALQLSEIKKHTKEELFLSVIVTGLLSLGHGLFLKYQLSMMSDMVSAFLNAITLLLCWKSRQSGRFSFYLFTGIFLGLSIATRYSNALMVIPVISVFLTGKDFKQIFSIKNLVLLFSLGLSAFLLFLPQLYITLQDTSSSLGNGLLHGWSLKNFLTLQHESIDGSQLARIPSLLYYAALPFRWQCFTPFGIILIGLGIKNSIRELPGWLWVSLLVWYGVNFILLGGIPLQNSRIGFPLFLPVVVWISLGIFECRKNWPKQFPKIATALTAVWLCSLAVSFYTTYQFIQTKHDLKSTAEKLVQKLPVNSRIISTSLFAVYKAYPVNTEPLSIYTMKIEEAKRLFPSDKPTFLAIDEKHFNPQWMAYPPGKCYQWIKQNYQCLFRFKIGEYTIYEVKPIVLP